MKGKQRYEVYIEELDGKKVISVMGFVLSKEMDIIRKKIGDVNKLPIGKKFVIYI